MTIFSSKMPIVLTLRIWDIFFIEGLNVIYKIIVAIFKINKDKIMKSDLIGIKETIEKYLQETTKPFSMHKRPIDDDEQMLEIEKINTSISDHKLYEYNLHKKIDHLLQVAEDLGFTDAKIAEYEKEYEENPDDALLEFCLV